MNSPEQTAILDELAVSVARYAAETLDSEVVCAVKSHAGLDIVTLTFSRPQPGGLVLPILRDLTDLGRWIPERVRIELIGKDVHITELHVVRATPT